MLAMIITANLTQKIKFVKKKVLQIQDEKTLKTIRMF